MPGRPVPRDDVQRASATRSAHVGHSQWNGVAILSRVGIEDVEIGFPGMPSWSSKEGLDPAPEARALGATCGGVRVWSLYVPNGRTLADPHLQYKLEWLEALRTTAAGWLADDPAAQVALVGDWNIAPENDDVWDMAVFAHSTHVSPPERAAFRGVVEAGFADVVRPYTPGPRRLHLLGLHAAALPPPRGHADRLRARLPRAGRPGHRRAASTARSARARAPATTRP